MRILHVSAADHMGGAEQVGWLLFDSQRSRGHHAWLAVGRKTTNHPAVFEIPNHRRRNLWARACTTAAAALKPLQNIKGMKRVQLILREPIAQPLRTRAKRRGEEDFEFPGTVDLLSLAPSPPELVHCHNLHSPQGYFDLRQLPAISQRQPTIVTLHDAWLLAGHCAHSFECERWLTGCGEWPDGFLRPSSGWTRRASSRDFRGTIARSLKGDSEFSSESYRPTRGSTVSSNFAGANAMCRS